MSAHRIPWTNKRFQRLQNVVVCSKSLKTNSEAYFYGYLGNRINLIVCCLISMILSYFNMTLYNMGAGLKGGRLSPLSRCKIQYPPPPSFGG
jgi:hypothetical protein